MKKKKMNVIEYLNSEKFKNKKSFDYDVLTETHKKLAEENPNKTFEEAWDDFVKTVQYKGEK